VSGILAVLTGALALTFHNIVVRVLFSENLVLGVFLWGGYVTPTLENSFLLMFMRMLFVVPVLAILSLKVYPNAVRELVGLWSSDRQTTLLQALACGVLMFANIAMLYIAIGSISTGIAMTLFFIYPVFTALFSWQFFGVRPTRYRWIVMGIILLGSVLTIPQSSSPDTQQMLTIGVIASISGGIFYALYSVIAQKCFEKLHPIPFTWISFAMTLLLSALTLLVWQRPDNDLAWVPMWIGSLLSGFISFVGHTLTNVGIRIIGATAASIIGSSSPALTAVIAWATIRETLEIIQVVGILIVTLGIALLSGEQLWAKRV
jgi:drug/metabolite transporter (DMT)-like permease